MPSSKKTASLVLCWLLTAAAGLTSLSGCYQPSILDGGFICGLHNACPDGYSCVGDRCRLPVRDASTPDVHSDKNVCTERVAPAGCVPDLTLACDPVCQTGCCSNQKCTALNKGTRPPQADLGCVTNDPVRGFNDPCDVTGAGTPQRADNCGPGLIGIAGNSGAFCLKLCRTDQDCDQGTKCEQRPIDSAGSFSASVCGLPGTPCDPTASSTSGCPANRTCYLVTLSSAKGDTTICEISSGERRNTSCKYSRECLVGYTCAAVGPGAGICRPVCSHAAGAPSQQCPPTTICQSFGETYDYCN